MSERFFYGGQAVIEGVMIRGRRFFSLVVRRPNGQLHTISEPLHPIYTGRLRSIPLVRGILVLVETLVLGVRALNRSASIALEEEGEEGKELPRWAVGTTLALALLLGIGLFFILPLFLVRTVDHLIASDLLSNLIEGLVRLGVLVGYIKAVGLMGEIRRVFAYHGAEHMTVHTYEAGEPLEVERVKAYSTAHPRCGTAFLLVVMVVAILVFAFLGRPPMLWRVLSRVALIPVIAAVSYEVIRFSGAHARHPLVRAIIYPSLWLQSLTTRRPDEGQIEVAIHAMKTAIAADEGREVEAEVEAAEEPASPEEAQEQQTE